MSRWEHTFLVWWWHLAPSPGFPSFQWMWSRRTHQSSAGTDHQAQSFQGSWWSWNFLYSKGKSLCILYPVLVPYPVLTPSDKAKAKSRAPIAVIYQVTITHPGSASNSATGGYVINFLLRQGSHLNGWNIAKILITWHDKNPGGKSTFVLEHCQGNFALMRLFNDITVKKNWCLLKMKICSYSILNFGLQRTNLPRHTFSCI